MKRAIRTVVLGAVASSLAFSLVLTGCLVEAPGTGGDSQRHALTSAPPVNIQNGAVLDDKVQILGVKLDPGRAMPGEKVKVTAYFKVLEQIPQDYLVFVHVEDADGNVRVMNYDHPPARGTYPTSQWRKGETVQDEFEIDVPASGVRRGLNIWMGLWHAQTDTRMKLTNPQQVRNDGNNRILLATLPMALP